MNTRRCCVSAKSLVLACLLLATGAFGQSYPSRAITMVSAFPAGSGADLAARAITPALAEVLGQTVIVDNRAGAGGAIGARSVAKAAPDGYTLFAASISFAMMAAMTEPGFDALKDFEPIMVMGTQQLFFVVQPSLPVSTLKEFVDYARSRPGQLNYGTGGVGSMGHLQMEVFKRDSGTNLVHVPYKGTPEAMSDLIGGRVQLVIVPAPVALPQIKAGKLKALSVQGNVRDPALPEVPTTAQAGYPNAGDGGWYIVMAPGGTPREVVTKLNAALRAALAKPRTAELLAGAGLVAETST
ncbi:MAG: tripartite tricarboxylate transporter substrate-binding protein, partial [Pseudomonadota bacterium]